MASTRTRDWKRKAADSRDDLDLDLENRSNDFDKIPENILLEILRYLSVKDLCSSGRVCRKWRRVVADNSLWRHVDLRQYKLDLTKMWKVLRAHFSPCLLTMKVGGFAHAATKSRNKMSVSDAMLKELSQRCPNLRMLHLHDCNTENLSFESLPASLAALCITKSSWKPRWMKGMHSHLVNLGLLDLTSTVRVDNFDLSDIAQFTALKKLSLSNCYRVKGPDIGEVTSTLTGLESLNLSSTEVDDLAIHHIARNLKNLKELFLAHCSCVNNSVLATIASGLKDLQLLDISYCEEVTLTGLQCLGSLKELQYLLIIRKERISDEVIRFLKKEFVQPLSITVT